MTANLHRMIPGLLLLALLAACHPKPHFRKADSLPEIPLSDLERRFEGDIALMEAKEADSASAQEGIVFAGSSSFTRWATMAEDLAPLPVVNRGFGGSGIRQVSYYADRIILPLRPRLIVFYCGENDICNDNTPHEKVLADFKDFVAIVRHKLPDTRIVFISMKPSPLRWQWWPKFQEGNVLVRKYTGEQRGLRYVDVGAAMLDSTGRPHRGIWQSDSLHMNEKGYALWIDVLKPVLREEWEKCQH